MLYKVDLVSNDASFSDSPCDANSQEAPDILWISHRYLDTWIYPVRYIAQMLLN